MPKKDQIILTHGTSIPDSSYITLGEVLVQHAVNAIDAALHTVLNDGTTIVSFPSKEWVRAEIAKNFFMGTQEEYNTAYNAGNIPNGCIVIITNDETTAKLGTAILGKMILGQE